VGAAEVTDRLLPNNCSSQLARQPRTMAAVLQLLLPEDCSLLTTCLKHRCCCQCQQCTHRAKASSSTWSNAASSAGNACKLCINICSNTSIPIIAGCQHACNPLLLLLLSSSLQQRACCSPPWCCCVLLALKLGPTPRCSTAAPYQIKFVQAPRRGPVDDLACSTATRLQGCMSTSMVGVTITSVLVSA